MRTECALGKPAALAFVAGSIAHCGSAPLRSSGRIRVERARCRILDRHVDGIGGRPATHGAARLGPVLRDVPTAGHVQLHLLPAGVVQPELALKPRTVLDLRPDWALRRSPISPGRLRGAVLVLVLLAVYWRTESWLAGLLAAALVGIGARDFLEPRAAIVGLLCLAALWALICAIEGQRHRRRWWPIALLLPLLVFWSSAHGGFVFGYGLLSMLCGAPVAVRLFRAKRAGIVLLVVPLVGRIVSSRRLVRTCRSSNYPGALRWLPLPVFVAYWVGVRYGKSDIAASERQILCVAVVLVMATVITLMLSPFGIVDFHAFRQDCGQHDLPDRVGMASRLFPYRRPLPPDVALLADPRVDGHWRLASSG